MSAPTSFRPAGWGSLLTRGEKGLLFCMTILDFLLDRSTPIRELSRVTQAKSFVFMFVEFELPRGLFFTLSTYNSTS